MVVEFWQYFHTLSRYLYNFIHHRNAVKFKLRLGHLTCSQKFSPKGSRKPGLALHASFLMINEYSVHFTRGTVLHCPMSTLKTKNIPV